MLIKSKECFRKEMEKFHLSKPRLSINFEDNFSDELRDKWRKMDMAILEVIWQITKENNLI
jgi:hypothetical protein